MTKAIDITGQRFEKLVAIAPAASSGRGVVWQCLCDCGATAEYHAARLRAGAVKSCGCLKGAPRQFVSAGTRYGRLVCLDDVVGTKARCRVVCDCGVQKTVGIRELTRGLTVSCGCHAREVRAALSTKHGMAGSSEYHAWSSMRARCNHPRDKRYKNYGARGIRVCERWDSSFEAFFADVGPKPSRRHSLDRFPDNNGNYEPGNVRWATATEQARNTRISKLTPAVVAGIREAAASGKSLRKIAAEFGIGSHYTVRRALMSDWTPP